MPETRSVAPGPLTNPWPLVLTLVGVDYFSTLAYLPSIAVQAAGPFAPLAAGAVVLVTFLMALPVYWYVVGRSPEGRGATGLLEKLIPGWRGKIVVLTLLGFVAADFVITRSLSLADAAIHLIHNPHGQRLLQALPAGLHTDDDMWWPPLAYLLKRIAEPQVAITLSLSIISFGLWQVLKHGVSRRILYVTATAVSCYLALTGLVIGSAVVYVARHPEFWQGWLAAITSAARTVDQESVAPQSHALLWASLSAILWSFPQMALGLSGFEMIMTVTPQVSADAVADSSVVAGRVRNTRKLMLAAVSIMAVYMVSAVVVTTLLVPQEAVMPGGTGEHRSLAYLAHGSPLVGDVNPSSVNPLFGERFGDVFDLSSVCILCLAGATVTMGLQNLVPHYLHRLGMEVSWAGKVGAVLHVLNAIVLLITVVFRASPSSQQWAYATSVLMLLAGTALAATTDLRQLANPGFSRYLLIALSTAAGGFFLVMTGLTALINYSGLLIAMAFVVAIMTSSFVSRWIRSTELRFEGFDFADEPTANRWNALCKAATKALVPHRPGLTSLAERSRTLHREYYLDPAMPLVFVEVMLGDPSNFYQKPLMRIEREDALEVIRVSRCVSISHVLAAMCMEMCREGCSPPEIIFGWSEESPLAANLNFLLLGEGNVPWMVKELVRRAMPKGTRPPRIRIG